MMIYPTIELMDGRCVSVTGGHVEAPAIWHVDPVEAARGFAAAGAEWMHVTDYDWIAGRTGNRDLILEIVRAAGIPVQLRGGFATMESIAEWLDIGLGRIALGTVAVHHPQLVKEAAKYHPDQIVVAIDVYRGQVMTHGGKTATALEPAAFLRQFDVDPLAAAIVTDLDADLGEAEDSLALVTRLAGMARTPVIASGLARSLDDISRIRYVPHIAGTLLGRALFDKSVDLAEALAIARPSAEPKADFI